MFHNTIQIHKSVLWDWQYSTKYSPHSVWMWGILSVPQFTLMDLNNIMSSFLEILSVIYRDAINHRYEL